jgi:hypothetical protein
VARGLPQSLAGEAGAGTKPGVGGLIQRTLQVFFM